METKTITVCTANLFTVNCEYNDPTDINCGGPAILGYDFYVSPDEDITEVKRFIKKCLKKYDRPLLNIITSKHKNFPTSDLWDMKKIEKCIKEISI
jgi:hypothetical protein